MDVSNLEMDVPTRGGKVDDGNCFRNCVVGFDGRNILGVVNHCGAGVSL